MKKLVPVWWLVAGLMLLTSVVFADAKIRPTHGLQTSADGAKSINWQAETVAATNTRDIDLAYHDGSFEGQLGVGTGGAGFGVRFSPPGPVFLTGLTLYFQGDAGSTAGVVSIYADPSAGIAGPPSAPVGPGDGSALWESAPMDLSSPDGSLVTITIPLESLPVSGGDFYVVVWDGGAFLGIANDLQLNYLDRNWVTLGSWSTLNDATGGDPTLTGNFGITATYLPQDINGSYMVVGPTNLNFGVLQIDDGAVAQNVTVSNLGNAAYDITAISITGAELSTNLTAPVTVPMDSSVTMEVTITPATAGPFNGSIEITSNADNATSATVNVSAMIYDGFPEFMVWNPSGSISGPSFVETLTGLGYTAFETTDVFQFGAPADAGYTAIFVCLGIYSDNYSLADGDPEVGALIDYINAGGPVYMEGGDTWAFDSPTALHGYFNIDGVSDGSGDLTTVTGADFASGMDFSYAGGNSWIDHLAPLTPESFVIHNNPADNQPCGIAFLSANGNTIGTSFEFGGLVDGATTKAQLLQTYIDFFTLPYTDIVFPVISGVTRFDFTMDTVGPYVIDAVITDNTILASTSLFYSTDGTSFTEVAMAAMGNDVYEGEIPGQAVGTTVGYYISATDTSGNTTLAPEAGTYAFSVLSSLPPVHLAAESGLDGHSVLTWDPPGTTAPPQLDCADYMIDGLPYNATGSTVGAVNDFDVSGSDNEDVAYQIYLSEPTSIDISLCNGTSYDSKLEVFNDDCVTSTGYYNDDACGLQSRITNVALDAGVYLIVVDGFSTAQGNYTLDVTVAATAARSNIAQQVNDLGYEVQKLRENDLPVNSSNLSSATRRYYEQNPLTLRNLVGYGIYRATTSPVILDAGNLVNTIDSLATTYDDSGLVNGTTYYYRVSAIYNDDEAGSEEVSATPVNHIPTAPFALTATSTEGSLVAELAWQYPVADYDFNHFAIYREGYLIGTSVTTSYSDTAPAGGNYHYFVVTVDNDGAESEPSNTVFIGLGNIPPLNLVAVGNLDGHVNLSWLPPNANPGEPMFESFEEGMPANWEIQGIAGLPASDSWRITASATAPDGAQVAMCGDGQSGEFIDEWMITNDIPVGAMNSTLSFYHYASALSWDNAPNYLKISTDGGTNWDVLFTWDPTGATPLPNAWTLVVADLSSYSGASVRLAWEYTSTYGEFWYVDAIELSSPARANSRPLALNIPVAQVTDKSNMVEDLGDVVDNHNLSGLTPQVNRERELTGYEVMRDGVSLATLDLATLSYTDFAVTNGTQYCYIITGLYPDGNSNSNESCATPINHPPMPPANLVGSADDAHNISLSWDANTDYDFASYNLYRDGELVTNTTATTFNENLPISNVYTYQVTAVDAEDMESAPSNALVLPVGNLPPSSLSAMSGLDGTIALHWTPPYGSSVGNESYTQDFEGLDWPAELMTYDEDGDGLTWFIYYPSSDVGYNSPQAAGVMYNSSGNDDWLVTPSLGVSGSTTFSFWASPQDPAYSQESFNVLVSTTGGSPADFTSAPVLSHEFPAGVGPDAYQQFNVDLSAYAGGNVWVAIQCTSIDQFVLKVDDIAIDGLTGVPGGALALRTGMRNASLLYATRAEYDRAVVNGYAFSAAPRNMAVETRELLGTYSIYRTLSSPVVVDPANLLATVDTLTFTYTDFPVLNGTTYYYVVTADYQTEQSASPEASATPTNHPPAMPVNLTGSGDELLNVTLDWDDNADYDLGFYRVYREDVLVGDNVSLSTYTEVVDSSGLYSYFVTAVDTQGMESGPSEGIRVAVGTLPPTHLMAESGMDGQVALTWHEPGMSGPEPLVCADEVIMGLPFNFVGSNAGMGNDFDVSGSDGEDMTFSIYVFDGQVINVTTCGAATNYDTKLEIFNSDCATSTGNYNDDGGQCTANGSFLTSSLLGVSLPEGTYVIVVDGFGGATGTFELTVSEATVARENIVSHDESRTMELAKMATLGMNPADFDMSSAPILHPTVTSLRTFDGYIVYRDGVDVSGTLPIDQLSYIDGYIPNGVEYCYTVAAVYTTASAQSEAACATPVNHAPSTPSGLIGEAGANHLVTLDWDDVTDYDLVSYHVYRNDTLIATVTTSDYSESPAVSNTYSYYVKAYDSGNLESERSNSVTLVVGEAPPLNLRANGNHDTFIALNWNAPGAGGVETEYRYDDGNVTGQLGFTAPGPNAVMGASWPINATLNRVDWYLTLEGGPHDQIYVYIFGLDAAGVPDVSQLLFQSNAVSNTDDSWNELELPEPISAPNGFYIGINTPNQFTGLALDDGVGEPYAHVPGTQWANGDVSAGNSWLDIGPAGFPQNFFVRAFGFENAALTVNYQVGEHIASKEQYHQLVYSELSQPVETINQPTLHPVNNDAMREIASFNVYRDGDLISNTVNLNYDDQVAENIDYLYTVTAVYDNSVESINSNEVIARANMAPGVPSGFIAEVMGHNVSLQWVDPSVNADGSGCNDLVGIKVYRDGTFLANVPELEWAYMDLGVSDGPHTYTISAYDEVPNISDPASAEVWVGPRPYRLLILTDNYPTETSWSITNSSGAVVMSIAPGSLTSGGTLYEWLLDIEPGDYTFTIFDSYGDGICCAYGEGYYQILNADDQILATGGDFSTQESANFTVELGIMMGDLIQDEVLNIADLTRMIEIIIHNGEAPTAYEMQVIDVTYDGTYNVLDAVMLVEMILDSPGLAKPTVLPTSPVEVKVPDVKLSNNTELWQEIPLYLNWDGNLAGFQATLTYDANRVEIGSPVVPDSKTKAQVFTAGEAGELRLMLLNPMGGHFSATEGVLVTLPVRVKSEETGAVEMELSEVVLGASGARAIENTIALGKVEVDLPLPKEFALAQNYPNPFNPTTTIKYQMPEDAQVNLTIYNMLGQVVKTLVSEQQTAGYYTIQWSGVNEQGQPVPTGIYIYQMRAGAFTKTVKMAYIK